MNINFKGKFKSLTDFEVSNLPKFVVITGINGSGKSHFLELLGSHKKAKEDYHNSIESLTMEPVPKEVQSQGIDQEQIDTVNDRQWSSDLNTYVNKLNSISIDFKEFIDYIYQEVVDETPHLDYDTFQKIINTLVEKSTYFQKLHQKILEEAENESSRQSGRSGIIRDNKGAIINPPKPTSVISSYNKFNNDLRMYQLLNQAKKFHNKPFTKISSAELLNTPYSSEVLSKKTLFTYRIERLFYNYLNRRDINHRKYFDKKELGEINNAISDDEFIKNHPQPWTEINQILQKNGMDFKFKEYDRTDYTQGIHLDCELIKISTNQKIKPLDLSSGEKTIIGLIVKLFITIYESIDLSVPDLLLLDEPDCRLHPDMSKLLIDVIDKEFSQKLGIQVIMVTHSPSTIALSPEDSIFQLSNDPITVLEKVSKNAALKLLTGNIPTLSIDYDNHKQVFVESDTDVKYYQTIFDKLNQDKRYPFNLYFLAYAKGKGNCDKVIKIVKELRKYGSTTTFGIIDWDEKKLADKEPYVTTHGKDKRYSIENFIYDPIYMSCLLYDLNNRSLSDLGIDETFNQYSMADCDEEFLQKISDWFYSQIQHKCPAYKNLLKTEIQYFNGKKILIPKWALTIDTHKGLEGILKKTFISLEKKYTSEGQMQLAVSKIIGKLYPLVPLNTVETIEEIINSKA